MSEIPTSSQPSSYFFSSYVKRTLQKGESQPVFFSLTPWQFAEAAFHCTFLSIVPVVLVGAFNIGLGILTFCLLQTIYLTYVHFKRNATEYAVSNKRVVIKTGILSRYTNEVRPEAIEAVTVNQGILGRMLNFGDCLIRGRGVGKLSMSYVVDPLKVKTTIEQHTS